MNIDFTLALREYEYEPTLYDVCARAYNEAGDLLEQKTWMQLSATKAVSMFSAFRVRVIRQYNPKVDDPPADTQLELPF